VIRAGALTKVLRQNIRRNFRSLALSSFGIVVGIAAFVFFWGLSAGVSKVVLHDIFPIDRVEVIAPKTSLTGLTMTLDDALVDKIKARKEVQGAFPKMKLAFPARSDGNLLGSQMHIEIGGFCDGMDPKLVDQDHFDAFKDWEATEGPGAACTIKGDTDDCPKDHY
jgi:hypothetical protein